MTITTLTTTPIIGSINAMSDPVDDEHELAAAVEALKAAEDRVTRALRAYLTRDPVTGRPAHGRIGRAARITGWGEQRVKETVTPALAERRRAKRAATEEVQR
ncbi:hypothetical protein ACGH2B_27935 [Streptomyces sp. BBFR2]|uniref:hypothetical protein n=1 Tax=Streptomyces sp. BBFR2 TaxID=3372854 RepID=UPI0037DA082B